MSKARLKMKEAESPSEAILLASPNWAVADYLVTRGKNPHAFRERIPEKIETALLEREDRLIDLRLAEFGSHLAPVKTLFQRSINDPALRELVLSNQAVADHFRFWLTGFPACLFDGEEALKTYLATAPSNELLTLFSNPTLHYQFVENVLSLGDYWQAMPEQERFKVLYALSRNPMMQKPVGRSHYPDHSDWGNQTGFFTAAWRLVIELDVTGVHAATLARFYENLTPFCQRPGGILEALSRWVPQDDEEDEHEKSLNGHYSLSDYQLVRRSVAAMLAENRPYEKFVLLQSDDIAVRCGAYVAGKHTPREMRRAIKRDGWWATVSLMENPNCWRTAGHRQVFIDAPASNDEFWFWFSKFKKKHPEWFELSDLEWAAQDRPLSESSTGELVRHVFSSPRMADLGAKVESLKKAQRVQLIILIVALAIILFRH